MAVIPQAVALSVDVLDAHGDPLPGARVTAHLNRSAIDSGGAFVLPASIRAVADDAGRATVQVWPNTRGNWPTHYDLLLSADETLAGGRFEAVAQEAPTVAHEASRDTPAPAVQCLVRMAFAYRDTAPDGSIQLRPAPGVSVHLAPDRWDVTTSGFVAPTDVRLVADQSGEAQAVLFSAGARGAEILLRVSGECGRHEVFRLAVPAADTVSATDIDVSGACNDAARDIVLIAPQS